MEQSKPSQTQYLHLLETVSQLSEDILGTLDLSQVLETAVRSTAHLLDVTSAYISEWDEETELFTVIAEYYQPAASAKERVSDVGHVYHMTLDFGVPISWLYEQDELEVTHFDDADLSPTEQAHLMKYDGKTVLEVVLRARGRPVGTMELWESRQKRVFSKEDLELVKIISQQVALAIVNARLYQQAQAANLFKSDLIAKISHEFRTPLTALQGFAELFRTGMYGTLTEKQTQKIHSMLDSIRYLMKLVDQLMVQSEIDSRAFSLMSSRFTVQGMVADILPQLELLAEQQDVAIYVHIDQQVPKVIVGDESRIQQIIINLASNALKFTEQGRVDLFIERGDAEQWMLRVQDTGVGITSEARKYIFEPFKQAPETAKQNQRGSGLGLAIVKQLVDLMGGSVTVESVVGEGSTFTVQLPLQGV